MKLEKSRIQEGNADIVSVCGALDVSAIASGEHVTIYRMQLSKVASASLGAQVTDMCWGPNGRTLCCGTKQGLRLVHVEDGTVIGEMWDEEVVAVTWVKGAFAQVPVTDASAHAQCTGRSFGALESAFQPPLTPFHLAHTDADYAAIRLRHGALENASAAYGKGVMHFVVATVRGHDGAYSLRVVPFAATEMMRIALPWRVFAVAPVGGLRSVTAVACSAETPHIVGMNIHMQESFVQLSKVALYMAMLEEVTQVLQTTVAEMLARIVAAERNFAQMLTALPDPLSLFIKGPVSTAHKHFFSSEGDLKLLHKTASPLHSALTDLTNLLSLQVLGSCETIEGMLEYIRHDLASLNTPQPLPPQQSLRVGCMQVIETASASQINTAQLFGWLSEMSLYTARRRDGTGHHTENGEEPTYDKAFVLGMVSDGAPLAQKVRLCSAALTHFASSLQALQTTARSTADAVRVASSLNALGPAVPISALPHDATAPLTASDNLRNAAYTLATTVLPKKGLTIYAAASKDSTVNMLMVKDKGPHKAERWATRKTDLPVSGCLCATFYVSADEADVRFLVLVEEGGAVALKSFAVVQDGAFPEALTESSLILELPERSDTGRAKISCSPKGLACVTVGAESNTFVAEFLLDDDDDDEEDEEEATQ